MKSIRFLAMPLGMLVILVLTIAAFGLPIFDSLDLLYEGALADKFGIHRTLVKSAPLIMVAIGLIVAWRAGMFNIGGEGQLLVGVVAGATVFKLMPGVSGGLLNLLVLLTCATAGALYAGFAGYLFVKRGVNIVISTILLNFVAIHLMSYVTLGPLQETNKSIPQTDSLPQSVMFQRVDSQTDLHTGILICFAFAFVAWVWLSYTKSGLNLRLVGSNANAARSARLPVERIQIKAMLISGGLCGLAGGIEYLGVSGYLFQGFSPQWGFLGIPVALLGGLHPIGAVCSGLYFGALISGASNLEKFGQTQSSIVFVIQAIGVLAYVAFRSVVKRKAIMAVSTDE